MDSSGVSAALPRCLPQTSKRNCRDWSRVGLNIPPLRELRRLRRFFGRALLLGDLAALRKLALLEDRALRAQRLLRHARVAAVEDEVVMGVAQELLRRD